MPRVLTGLAVSAGSESQNIIADAAGPDTFTCEDSLRLLASAVGGRPVGAYAAVPEFRPDQGGRPDAARRGADQGRGRRFDGGVADVWSNAFRNHQARPLVIRQRGHPGEQIRG